MTYKIAVISSYIWEQDDASYTSMGRRNRWVNGFVTGLLRNRSSLQEVDLAFHRIPATQAELRRLLSQFKEQGVGLLIMPGTDAAIRVAEVNREIPMLYFGAHPENNGMELLNHPLLSGVRLNLPLVWSYSNFSVIKEIIPDVKRVYVPWNFGCEFTFPNVRVNYELFRARKQGPWVPGGSTYVAHRSWQFLSERLGAEYFEGPFANIDEVRAGLDAMQTQNSVLVAFNDTVLNQAAVDLVMAFVKTRRVPLFWINNPNIISAVGVADFSSDFEKVGRTLAPMALAILRDGTHVKQLSYEPDPGQRTLLNLRVCNELGYTPSEPLQKRFDEVLR